MLFDPDDSEIKVLREETEINYFKSRFSFLDDHNGLRPGKMHLAIGVSGGGKSTLVRSIVLDVCASLFPGQTMALHASEESCQDVMQELSAIEEIKDHIAGKLHIWSEQQTKMSLNLLKQNLIETAAQVLIFDNITTSDLYAEKHPSEQQKIIKELKKMADELQIPFLLIAHTGGEIDKNHKALISGEKIRGAKSAYNLTEFCYVLQTFFVNGNRLNFLSREKNRGFTDKGKYYQLAYNNKFKIFTKDKPVNFGVVKEWFNERDKLS